MKKVRIDQLLVKRGLVSSRETAQRLILAGKVLVDRSVAAKPSELVGEEDSIQVLEAPRFVSRGGFKLEKALDEFGIDVSGRVAVDIGASTGGFTDCLLQRGAKKVYAIDTGYGQFAWKLRKDPRVILLERTNARNLEKGMFSEPIDLIVVDVSFISALKILEPASFLAREAVLLFKPQFEAGPRDVPRGGVIRDPKTHRKTLRNFYEALLEWQVHGLIESPIPGGDGNREFLVHLKKEKGWDVEKYAGRVEELIR
jgi:23S rRNA (cytidine1920-2'-O)/16S rRNA (cytidine1409-2'-O)-methyltransferase